MTRDKFGRQFIIAVERSLQTASRYIIELLPKEPMLHVVDRSGKHIGDFTVRETLSRLYRNGSIPLWIDISVQSIENGKTIHLCQFSEEFTDNDQVLYHKGEGIPPFHVQSPTIPPGIFLKRENMSTKEARALRFSIKDVPKYPISDNLG